MLEECAKSALGFSSLHVPERRNGLVEMLSDAVKRYRQPWMAQYLIACSWFNYSAFQRESLTSLTSLTSLHPRIIHYSKETSRDSKSRLGLGKRRVSPRHTPAVLRSIGLSSVYDSTEIVFRISAAQLSAAAPSTFLRALALGCDGRCVAEFISLL